MKYILGIIFTIIILGITAFGLLNLWGIEQPISTEHFVKFIITVGILSLVALVLVVFLSFFFRTPSKGYAKNSGVAGKKENQ